MGFSSMDDANLELIFSVLRCLEARCIDQDRRLASLESSIHQTAVTKADHNEGTEPSPCTSSVRPTPSNYMASVERLQQILNSTEERENAIQTHSGPQKASLGAALCDEPSPGPMTSDCISISIYPSRPPSRVDYSLFPMPLRGTSKSEDYDYTSSSQRKGETEEFRAVRYEDLDDSHKSWSSLNSPIDAAESSSDRRSATSTAPSSLSPQDVSSLQTSKPTTVSRYSSLRHMFSAGKLVSLRSDSPTSECTKKAVEMVAPETEIKSSVVVIIAQKTRTSSKAAAKALPRIVFAVSRMMLEYQFKKLQHV